MSGNCTKLASRCRNELFGLVTWEYRQGLKAPMPGPERVSQEVSDAL